MTLGAQRKYLRLIFIFVFVSLFLLRAAMAH